MNIHTKNWSIGVFMEGDSSEPMRNWDTVAILSMISPINKSPNLLYLVVL